MYKFTNGIVVFDEKTRDNFLEAGYKLEIKSEKIELQHIPAGMVSFDEEASKKLEDYIKDNAIAEKKNIKDYYEESNENSSNDGTIEEKPRRNKKVSK